MNERKPSPSFSVVQVVCAWLVGLLLGSGALGMAGNERWRVLFTAPFVFGLILSLISSITFIAAHWSDHD
jgi:hypothetical protein